MSEAPLDDVTVIELGHIVAGPFCGLILSDLGAEVIKVEHPAGGDSVRESSPVGTSLFAAINRNKRSVTLDLKSEGGREAFEKLVGEADAVVENFAEGAPDRLGVGYEDLREVDPSLVYCSIKGFGDGPYRDYPALDPIAEAMSGLMSVTGREGHPPVRVGTSVADMAAAMYGAIGVLAALRHRDRTGEGQFLRAPLFESTATMMGYWLTYTDAYDEVPGPQGASHPNWSPYDVFETADDEWAFVGPSSQGQWEALCDALDAGHLAADDRFDTIRDRRAHDEELVDELQAVIDDAGLTRTELIHRLRDAGVPVAPVNDTAEALADEHLAATDFFAEVDAEMVPETDEGDEDGPPDARTVQVSRSPLSSTGFDRQDATDPPGLGEDTDAVLEALGYSAEEIADLRETGAIGE